MNKRRKRNHFNCEQYWDWAFMWLADIKEQIPDDKIDWNDYHFWDNEIRKCHGHNQELKLIKTILVERARLLRANKINYEQALKPIF